MESKICWCENESNVTLELKVRFHVDIKIDVISLGLDGLGEDYLIAAFFFIL